jgi:hypothetical protein
MIPHPLQKGRITVCSGTRSTCPLDEEPNTPAALFNNCFFNSTFCVRCSSNCWQNSAKALSSRNAAKATLALNSALFTRRFRRPDDLLIMVPCPSIFAVAKNPNNALIRPVQFCRATYIFLLRISSLLELIFNETTSRF